MVCGHTVFPAKAGIQDAHKRHHTDEVSPIPLCGVRVEPLFWACQVHHRNAISHAGPSTNSGRAVRTYSLGFFPDAAMEDLDVLQSKSRILS